MRLPGRGACGGLVAEYLTARHLATLPRAVWLAVVELHQWFDPDWAEVISMLGERLTPDGARALIRHLLAAEHDPFHHALFTAARVWKARPDAGHLLARLTQQQKGPIARHRLSCLDARCRMTCRRRRAS